MRLGPRAGVTQEERGALPPEEGRWGSPGPGAMDPNHLPAVRMPAALLGASLGSGDGARSWVGVGQGGSGLAREPGMPVQVFTRPLSILRDANGEGGGQGGPAPLPGPGKPTREGISPPGLPHGRGWTGARWGSPALAQDPGEHTQRSAPALGIPRDESGGRHQEGEVWPRGEGKGNKRKPEGETGRWMGERAEGERRLESREARGGNRSEACWRQEEILQQGWRKGETAPGRASSAPGAKGQGEVTARTREAEAPGPTLETQSRWTREHQGRPLRGQRQWLL